MNGDEKKGGRKCKINCIASARLYAVQDLMQTDRLTIDIIFLIKSGRDKQYRAKIDMTFSYLRKYTFQIHAKFLLIFTDLSQKHVYLSEMSTEH